MNKDTKEILKLAAYFIGIPVIGTFVIYILTGWDVEWLDKAGSAVAVCAFLGIAYYAIKTYRNG